MQDIIHLLPDSVANQIAAGEVVQRPASIVKELVENSLDAGARCIQTFITDGGRTCVQVIDDGKGMSETDARLAFERHATSKITTANDLFSLTTMGFRGEALASIAAVAQVELHTRRPDDELGTLICMSGSKIERQEPVACPVGSNFSVNNLFFNVPARRKFLKSNQTELSNIVTDFERIVLAHPEAAFTLSNNKTVIYDLPASSLRQRINGVIGKKDDSSLIALDVETSIVKISGYVGQPQATRKRGQHQFFFVNGRFMNHPYFRSAVVHAYENLIPVGEQPAFFVYLSVDPASIDVNVHPTKTEIKFDNEQEIWQIIHAAVKEALGRSANIPTIEFDREDCPDIPVMDTMPKMFPKQPSTGTKSYNPFSNLKASSMEYNSQIGANGSIASARIPDNWETLFSDIQPNQNVQEQTDIWNQGLDYDNPDNSNIVYVDTDAPFFQYKGRFIVMPDRLGLLLVDQYRAHVKVLYERYMENLFLQKGASQGLLFPEIIQLSPAEILILEEIQGDLEYVGFDISNLGGGSYSINCVPSNIDTANPVKLLRELIQSAGENVDIKKQIHHVIALTMAKAVAIPYGQVLTEEEVRVLIDQLFKLSSPRYTPDGTVVFAHLSDSLIEQTFKK